MFQKKTFETPKYLFKSTAHLEAQFQPAFGCAQHPKAGRNTQHGYSNLEGRSKKKHIHTTTTQLMLLNNFDIIKIFRGDFA